MLASSGKSVLTSQVVVAEQQFEHVVALGARAGDRTEDAHSFDLVTEGVEHAEGDGGLTRVTLH